MTRPSIIVSRLILVGHRKEYVTQFNRGVNIIYGDSATGKSSILELINYGFGSKKFIYDVEIETSVKYLALEVSLNAKTYVIKRDIFLPNKLVEVYPAKYEEMNSVHPKILAPNYDSTARADGYLSDFLLGALELPILKVKESPSKIDSEMVRLSFRDLFKFNYLKQDDVGSKGLLGNGNWALANKNKQTFRYIFNLLDSNIAALDEELARISAAKRRVEQKFSAVSEFLRETQFESSIELSDSRDELNRQEGTLKEHLIALNKRVTSSSEVYQYLKSKLVEISAEIKDKRGRVNENFLAVERYTRLRNDYQVDATKLKGILEAKSLIGEASARRFPCPICENEVRLDEINPAYQLDESHKANHESLAISRRIKEIEELIQQERNKRSLLEVEVQQLNLDEEKARRLLDTETSSIVTPYLAERDGIASELATVRQKLRQIDDSMKIRNQHKILDEESQALSAQVIDLEKTLRELKKTAPSLDAVLSDLGDSLGSYLRAVNIKDPRDISISRSSFLPVLRNRDYGDITSGGLRTILSIGHLVILLEHAIHKKLNIAPFLMIDTVGKYLGKTQSQYNETDSAEDTKEGVADPIKYKNMYTCMLDLAERAELLGVPCQIILVDKDVPEEVQQDYAGFIIAHFSSRGESGLPFGLIDDAHLYR